MFGRSSVPMLALAVVAVVACGDSGTATTVDAELPSPAPAADFTDVVDNQWFPLLPGASWVYEGVEGDEVERIEVRVLIDDKQVMGIDAVVVRDVVSVDGRPIEDTLDWYAQDSAGNVWYLGEDSKEIEDGEVVNTAGSWESGTDGALPGIIMYADPMSRVGMPYYQEFYEGEAEDQAEVSRMEDSVTVAAGTFEDVLVIREWNPLEPGVVEEKYYVAGVGVILEQKVEGGEERVELITFTPGG